MAGQSDGRQGDRLDGWKAIAGYLGRDIRTVQRWELSEGLPVRRLEHRHRASAYAFTAELDAWLAARTQSGETPTDAGAIAPAREPVGPPASLPRSRRVLAGLAAAAGLVLLAAGLATFGPLPSGTKDTADPQAYSAFADGQSLYLARRYRDAAISLERAVTLDPAYGTAWAWLAKTYGRLAQPVWAGGPAAANRAAEAALRAARLAPEAADAHVALALAARARGDIETWRAEAGRALEIDPRAAEALALLGDSYSGVIYSCRLDPDPERAEDYYRRAMELRPGLSMIVSNRAGNLRRLGRHAECIELVNRTLRDYPDETPLLAVRGVCRLLQGDVDGATEDIAPLRSNPRIAQVGSLVYLGLLALRTGRTEEGVRDLEAFTQFDRSAQAELIAAEAYGLAGHVDRAAAHIRRAIAIDPACAGFVASSIAFRSVRGEQAVENLLAARRAR
jgi:Tfp pilus assembly protein PilF